jgi:hypothetical protein
MPIAPSTSGIPTSANETNPNPSPPSSIIVSDASTLTGDPVSSSMDPAWAPNASGISSFEAGAAILTATTTTTGNSAATEPFGLMKAVSTATVAIISTTSRRTSPPERSASCWPAQVVTPETLSASLTTNNVAMKITVGSPNPASDRSRSSTPVAHSASDAAIATIATGTRFETNSTTIATMIA